MTDLTFQAWWVLCAGTLGATTTSLLLIRPVLRRRGMVDTPNHRSSHSVPTLRGGGAGVLIGLLGGWVVAALLAGGLAIRSELGALVVIVVVVCLFGVVGWCEDSNGLSIWSRLATQLAIAIGAALGFSWMTQIPATVVALTVPALVFYVNVANFMDGINGISAQHGVVVAAYFGVVAYFDGDLVRILAAGVFGCAFLSFLPWNVGRARMFLGDSGSYVLGASAAILAIWTMSGHSDVLVVVAPFLIYTIDVIYTLMRRLFRHASLVSPHREHVYQRLQQATDSHVRAALLVTTLTSLCCALGLLSVLRPTLWLAWYAAALIVMAVYLASPRWISSLQTFSRRPSSPIVQAAGDLSEAVARPGGQ